MERIEVNNITKTIKNKLILDDINITFYKGNIYGLYGRNGCGKTMLLRALAGLIHLTKGKIYYDEKELHKDMDFPENMGMIIENLELLPQYDAYTNLKLLADIKNKIGEKEIREALKKVNLDDNDKKKEKNFSLGMKQKLAIAQAIMEKPEVLLLDEPTNGLDEESLSNIRNVLLEAKERGCIVLLASHNKEDLLVLADYIVKMKDGKIQSIEGGEAL